MRKKTLNNYVDLLSEPTPTPIQEGQYKNIIKKSKKIKREEKLRSRIYFIQAEDREIKIGFTLNVERRIQRMQMDCPLKLYLIGVLKGDRYSEARIHDMFKEYRKMGEWFYPKFSIIRYARANSINVKKSHRLKKFMKT